MRTFDFSPLYRSAVGFDRLMTVLDAAQKNGGADSYPPYNIEKIGEDVYQITVAVAGFSSADLDVEVRDGQLLIVGKGTTEEQDNHFLHRGIARRAFERRFQLADHVEVKAADLADGLLRVDLIREIPEAMKPRKIRIQSSKTVIEGETSRAA
ncbi:MAG: Hsp20 family protein [Pseudomonadota bacterium]|nr:Hsp20 family protein [Pseudomonadota bacterium]MEC8087541.1 Hsp20 family protein [Pseudomonadota bacterium]MEC8288703.1 Hsp20 family protein [Pseudomonadota bacterium]MEC8462450.1 Hsp20 family protein [Pseudomonadota bacterium]MEC8532330.1 Hsp20 family protein [Pseudomonadota bacterium]